MSIVTKTGDKGQTGLYGSTRVSKADARMHAIGSVDELNAALGLALADTLPENLKPDITRIQHELFHLGADLATLLPGPPHAKRTKAEEVSRLEAEVTRLEAELPPLQHFILPSGSRAGAHLHLARTICRRAERWVVELSAQEEINPQVLIYLNRLSDLLFLMARAANTKAGCEETKVEY